jgi:hypothetical protein
VRLPSQRVEDSRDELINLFNTQRRGTGSAEPSQELDDQGYSQQVVYKSAASQVYTVPRTHISSLCYSFFGIVHDPSMPPSILSWRLVVLTCFLSNQPTASEPFASDQVLAPIDDFFF